MSNQWQRLRLNRAAREKFDRIHRLEQIRRMDPVEFEQFVGYLYQKQGYSVSMTAVSGDEGIDLLLRKERRTAVVQCKRYAGTVGQPVVRDLYGAMMHSGADEAMLVTSGVLSQPAETWARGKPIRLVDGHELMSWTRRLRHKGTNPLQQLDLRWIGLAALAAVIVALLGVGLLLGIRTFQQRTAADPGNGEAPLVQPTPIPTTNADDGEVAPTVTGSAVIPTIPSGQTLSRIPVPRRDGPPAMDGKLDEWAAGEGIATPYVVARSDEGAAPVTLEATWWLAWDDNFLYLAAAVADDIHVQTQPPRLSYRGDSLEVQLDTDLAGDEGTLINGDDYQYLFSPGDLAGRSPAVFRFRGTADNTMADAPATGARITAVSTSYGYNVEAAIPWRDLDLTPIAGLTLGAALSVNDNDTPGTAVQEMMLSHVSTRRWRDPGSWGTLILEP